MALCVRLSLEIRRKVSRTLVLYLSQSKAVHCNVLPCRDLVKPYCEYLEIRILSGQFSSQVYLIQIKTACLDGMVTSMIKIINEVPSRFCNDVSVFSLSALGNCVENVYFGPSFVPEKQNVIKRLCIKQA